MISTHDSANSGSLQRRTCAVKPRMQVDILAFKSPRIEDACAVRIGPLNTSASAEGKRDYTLHKQKLCRRVVCPVSALGVIIAY